MLLQNGNTTLVVSPVGGNIERWQHGTTDVFFPRGVAIANGQPRISGGMHQCLPNFGKLPDHATAYGLPQHGALRGTLCGGIQLMDPNPNGQSHSHVSMRFDLPGNKISFPWAVGGSITIDAAPDGFLYRTKVVCVSHDGDMKTSMPMCFGLHPFFNTPNGGFVELLGRRRFFRAPMEAQHARAGSVIDVGLNGIGTVTMTMEGYHEVVIWSDSLLYACVEPITGNSRLFGSPEGQYLSPLKEVDLVCRFKFVPQK